MLNRIRHRWGTFIYNYSWSPWASYIDGWIPKVSLLFPVVGYLILFNDQITGLLEFHHLTQGHLYRWGLTGLDRLRLIYYGLTFLGVSNFIFRLRRPYIFRLGRDIVEYTRAALELFTLYDYVQIHGAIRHNGHLTPSGKYYDSEWDSFVALAQDEFAGTDRVKRTGDWEGAKSRYGDLLRSMLREHHFRSDTENRLALTTCLLLSTIGYAFLLLPSLDLFLKVSASVLQAIVLGPET